LILIDLSGKENGETPSPNARRKSGDQLEDPVTKKEQEQDDDDDDSRDLDVR